MARTVNRSEKRTNEFTSVLYKQFSKYGCPYCGGKKGFKFNFRAEGFSWQCDEEKCKKICFVLAKDLGAVPDYKGNVIPALSFDQFPARPMKNPRVTQPLEKCDVPVLIKDRSYRSSYCLCFACEDKRSSLYWLEKRKLVRLGFSSKEEAEAVVQMFGHGAFMKDKKKDKSGDYTAYVGVCREHQDKLEFLLNNLEEYRGELILNPKKIMHARIVIIHWMTNENY